MCIKSWLAIFLLAISNLIGCTTLQPQMAVELYTKNKVARNAVEQVAEEFCRKKRASLNATESVRQPDLSLRPMAVHAGLMIHG